MSNGPHNPHLRKTGISTVGDMPWGTHFCHFYETKQDLLEILVPYFQAGLENNEFCLWVVAAPVTGAEATRALLEAIPDLDQHLARRSLEIQVVGNHTTALGKAIPDLERHLNQRSIEIIPHDQWYLKNGIFDSRRVINGWKAKLDDALARGYAGMRVHGNEAWLTDQDWGNFLDYEKRLNRVLAGQKMLVLCTYPLSSRTAGEVFDVARAHAFAIAKRHGQWEMLETPELKQTKNELAALRKGLEQRVELRTRELAAANAALNEKQAKLKEAQRLANIGYWERDLATDRLTPAEESSRIFGLPPGHPRSQAELQEVIHPDDRPLQIRALAEALEKRRPYDLEYRVVRPDGQLRFVHVWDEIGYDESGRPVRMFGTVQDITERRRADEAARESQQLLELVLATLPVGVAVTDRAGDIVQANAASKRIWGNVMIASGPERWAKSKGFWHNSGDRIAPANWASVRALRKGQTSLNELIDIESFDGQQKTILNSAAPIHNAEVVIVGAVIVNEDVTERVRAEEALQVSEQRFRQLFARAPISIWEEDFSAVGDWLSTLRARGVKDLDAFLQAEPRALNRGLSLVRLVDVNDTALRLFEARSKEELPRLRALLVGDETGSVFAQELRAIWEGRHQADFECRAKTAGGRSIRCLLHWVAALEKGQMNLNRVIVAIADITELKNSEEKLRQTQAELARVARWTIMGELTASIAHEINQPLVGVVTNANACLQWLASAAPNLVEARKAVKRIARDGKRAGDVIARVRALLRKGEPVREPLNVNQVIRSTVSLLRSELQRKTVALRIDLAPELPCVPGDRVQLEQVIVNLILNAVDALNEVTGRSRVLRIRTVRPKPRLVRVEIRDTGVGIGPTHAKRLFEPFFTTKPNGLGLGLVISRSIIEAHGGRLWATPNRGPGMTFQFTLPIQNGGAW